MTQDFAKQRREKKPPPAPTRRPVALWFTGGFLSGAFATALIGLWLLKPGTEPADMSTEKPRAEPKTAVEEMQWDFYEIFPKSVVPVAEEYSDASEPREVDDRHWILQAGSFRDPKDADERRAELLLMGLPAATAVVEMQGNTWHRVIVGPFDTDLDKNRALDTLAQAQIQSIPKRVPRT